LPGVGSKWNASASSAVTRVFDIEAFLPELLSPPPLAQAIQRLKLSALGLLPRAAHL